MFLALFLAGWTLPPSVGSVCLQGVFSAGDLWLHVCERLCSDMLPVSHVRGSCPLCCYKVLLCNNSVRHSSVVFTEDTCSGIMCRIMAAHKCILSPLRKRPARRNLFGPVDREQLRLDYQAALRKDLEEASQRWGFDFTSNKPLESTHFQWEGVPGTNVPLLYRSCRNGLAQREGQRSAQPKVDTKRERMEPSKVDTKRERMEPPKVDTKRERMEPPKVDTKKERMEQPQFDKENMPGWPNRCALDLKSFEKTPEKGEKAGAKRKQTNLTDFYQAKRRVVWRPAGKSGE